MFEITNEFGYRPQYSYIDQLNDFKREMKEEPMAGLWGTRKDYE